MAMSWETTSEFFEASFRLIFCCYNASDCFRTSFHVVLEVDTGKLQIPLLQKTLFSPANDHSICASITDAKRQQCIKTPIFKKKKFTVFLSIKKAILLSFPAVTMV